MQHHGLYLRIIDAYGGHPEGSARDMGKKAPTTVKQNLREFLTRTPKRISITVSWDICRRLQERSDLEGRSISNLSSYLLEQGLNQ